MNINKIILNTPYSSRQNAIPNNVFSSNTSSTELKIKRTTYADSVSFSAKLPKTLPNDRMAYYAVNLIKKFKLKENQQLFITAESKYLPFLKILTEEAYKNGSGLVSLNIIEPELQILRKKYKISDHFEFQKNIRNELKENGTKFIKFSDLNCPYKRSGLSKSETNNQIESICPKIPQKIQDIFKLDPEEIFKVGLDIHEGQPAYISCQREQLPKVTKLVEWLYSKNKSKLVSVNVVESKELNPDVSFLKYAKDDLIGKFTQSSVDAQKEYFEKNAAGLWLCGDDPELYSDIDSKKIVQNSVPYLKAINEFADKNLSYNPWLMYYAPTTKSVKYSYPEYKNPIDALPKAYADANKINRVGEMKKHMDFIETRAKKLNEVLDKGYRTIRFVSVDPAKKKPDGNTNLKITLPEESFFNGARMDMKLKNHRPTVNIPTEEIFTSPYANSAEGWVSATTPLILNGKIIDGIRIKFKKGEIEEVFATKNLDMLKEHIKANVNANRLGEVALVADSPIYKMNRTFFETLLDENAVCHIALGKAYTDVVKGADDILDYAKQQEFLRKLNVNTSTTHDDFMIGGKNVYVYAENKKGDNIPIIIDDKFML